MDNPPSTTTTRLSPSPSKSASLPPPARLSPATSSDRPEHAPPPRQNATKPSSQLIKRAPADMNMIWINTMQKRHRLLQRLRHQDSSRSSTADNSLSGSDPDPDSDTNSTPKRAAGSPGTLDSASKILIAPLVPPLGFAMVAPGVYRSGHPNHCNFAFLDGLQLKSIMYICVDSYRPHTFNWAQDRGLKIFHYRIDSYKQPHSATSDPTERGMYASALEQILDRRNLPILIHCNKGKHRVGTLSALLRIIQGWDTNAVRAEWDKFLGEGAPPGKNMIWSPGLVFINNSNNSHHHQNRPFHASRASEPLLSLDALGPPQLATTPNPASSTPSTQSHKIKNKIADGLARVSEWEYVEQFPIELISVDPAWIPSWLPIESIDQ
ncbi:hypothetical protein PTTG_05574 [Puccinia triticina 1-1 BBBD Race 1]|uniref:Tyrosine specific protein phosphatases domain-containing protein n=2 Tax=Puccinia triticina TaxID=208348 RepID=A0A180GKC9_PUCT1|nr:uncharacterized protein PtA15_11A45 [Puccinia triticina]OAV93246.1 hypothetical protein PTTG_05574 [Puccinia triticina 1-1 BBBD Race 1]WAQ89358.1 hypothetical protein PtA15_11A45 [Puccinia triticina]WAR59407.1 hypothetical protein PtB15_11B47 [Puccinia triticina]